MNFKNIAKKNNFIIVFNDMDLGGIQRKIVDIISYTQNNYPNTSITLCLQRRKGLFLKQVPQNIRIINPPFETPRLNNLWFIFWLTYVFHKYQPSHILSFMDLSSIPTLIALKLLPLQKPHLTIGEDILTSKYVHIESFPKLRLKLIKKFYPQANSILVQTPVQKKDLHQIIGKSNNIIISPNWLPLVFLPKNINHTTRDIDILFIGRIEAQKNLKKFIQIIKRLSFNFPKIKAIIVGHGSESKTIKGLVKKLGLQKNIKIYPTTNNPQKFYLRSKIFLLTSDYEGFPLTLLEAISCGCYPVINNIPEIKKFFNNQPDKFIFRNQEQAVKKIENQISNPNYQQLKYYQVKITKSQNKNISLFTKRCLK